MSEQGRTRVLFIVGKGRSGSTLVGDVLGGYPGVFHMGEVWRLWSHGILGPHSCSCGLRVNHCPLWSEVLNRLASSSARWAVESPGKVVEIQRDLFSFGGVLRALLRGRYRSQAMSYRHLMSVLYGVVADETGSSLLVDSSKWPLDPSLTTKHPSIKPYVVHLVRNPRAVASSWKRRKSFPDSASPMPQFGPLHTALSWTARTLVAEVTVRRLKSAGHTIRFEDLLARPDEKLDEIIHLVGKSFELALPETGAVTLQPGHTVMGNPSRFASGRVVLEPPKSVSDPLVGALTWPWRRKFGY